MLQVSRETKIYILSPAFHKTGGTELAHQLVYTINNNGLKAQIVYYESTNNPMQINPAFKQYVNSFISIQDVIDSRDNIIIVPELDTQYLKKFKNIQKCIWWMSVDNYTKHHYIVSAYQHYGLWSTIKDILKRNLGVHYYPHFEKNITHFYQSEYARNFLEKAGITKVSRLSDYLNEEYLHLDIKTKRNDIVLYNPKKGLAFTQRLMKAAPDIRWVPLQNMTTEQVKETLLHSKVYIDFGNHPGKDRFPREAAMCGCCVITGKRGSAKFFEDVPIDNEFKYDESAKTIPLIISKIRECLNNYETESSKFNGYREFIKGEYQTFQDDVKSIFISNENTTK